MRAYRFTKIYMVFVAIFLIGLSVYFNAVIEASPDIAIYKYLIKESSGVFKVDPAFWLITEINNHFFNGIWFVFFVYASLNIGIVLYFIYKHAVNIWTSLIVYLGLYFILEPMIEIRAAVANAIFLLALYELYLNRRKYFLIKILLATLFHYSSLLTLPLVFLRNNRFNIKFYYFLTFIGLICFFIRNKIYLSLADLIKVISIYFPFPIKDKINAYLSLQSKGIITGGKAFTFFDLYSLLTTLVLLLIIYNYKHIEKVSGESIVYLKSCIYGNVFFLIFSGFPVMASRVSLFFLLPSIILYGDLCNLFKQRIFIKMIISFIALLYGLLFYLRAKGYISL